MRFRATIKGSKRSLKPPLADDVYRIGREALINAFQHSHGTSIGLAFLFKDDVFEMHVFDDGCGIDEELARGGSRENHFGLQGMRERAQRIGAKLILTNNTASGAKVELIVPAEVAYQDPRDVS
jgi:nitrate/nitrite-specific signal transduction histidine kinase